MARLQLERLWRPESLERSLTGPELLQQPMR
jgi:hypothetical protein